VEKNPKKFRIDVSEVAERRQFIERTKAFVKVCQILVTVGILDNIIEILSMLAAFSVFCDRRLTSELDLIIVRYIMCRRSKTL